MQHSCERSGGVCAAREAYRRNPPRKPLTSMTIMWARRTKYADFVTNVVILHEEFISPHHMIVEIPGDAFVHKLGSVSKEW